MGFFLLRLRGQRLAEHSLFPNEQTLESWVVAQRVDFREGRGVGMYSSRARVR